MSDRLTLRPGQRVRLDEYTPSDTNGSKRADLTAAMDADLEAIGELQELLFVAGTHAVLVILQGIDASGKDGTVRHVFSAVNPAGSRVVSFKQPTEDELAHDYLWRIHQACPPRGQIAVFNRSQYEAVLVERVHDLVPKEIWSGRYDQINAFEQLLTSERTIVLKFFLHISPEEQLERLNERIGDPVKRWKVNASDWDDRARWNQFRDAYEDMLTRTTTDNAPWTIVPADKKWYRNHVVASTIRKRLEPYRDRWRRAILDLGEKRLAAFKAQQKVVEAAAAERRT